jgi:hypothetical protein
MGLTVIAGVASGIEITSSHFRTVTSLFGKFHEKWSHRRETIDPSAIDSPRKRSSYTHCQELQSLTRSNRISPNDAEYIMKWKCESKALMKYILVFQAGKASPACAFKRQSASVWLRLVILIHWALSKQHILRGLSCMTAVSVDRVQSSGDNCDTYGNDPSGDKPSPESGDFICKYVRSQKGSRRNSEPRTIKKWSKVSFFEVKHSKKLCLSLLFLRLAPPDK